MADISRSGLNNQKRSVSVAVLAPTEADIVAVGGAQAITLPQRCLVTAVKTVVSTPSATAGAQVTLRVGAVAIATNVAVATAGVKTTNTPGYFPTGGVVNIVAGGTAPAAGNLVAEYIIEYVELDTVNGAYVG